jgi:hypothetical protein
MYSVEVYNSMQKEVVYGASGFSTGPLALEDAATYLLMILPAFVHVHITREKNVLHIYRRTNEQKIKPSGNYRYKEVNNEMRKHMIMEKVMVSSFELWYDVRLYRQDT